MTERWIVCLKHGSKYNADYVNKLYNMTRRNSNVPFGFACITEDPTGLLPEIKVIPLPTHYGLSGWWYKPWVFSEEFPLSGTIVFLDLDIVIIRNIDYLWTHQPEKFCIIRDFNRSLIKEWDRFNSSVFRFEKGKFSHVWSDLINDRKQIQKLHGDQDWIYNQIRSNFEFWPDDNIMSYKWEIRNRGEIVRVGHKRTFRERANPIIPAQTSILVFHGEPKPEDVDDPIVVHNWK